MHRLPLKAAIVLLQMLLSNASAVRAEQVVLHMFTEGEPRLFASFVKAFPQAILHLGNESSTLRDLDHMALAGTVFFIYLSLQYIYSSSTSSNDTTNSLLYNCTYNDN